ncbi:hypothetical protein JD844_022916 [Phrynosoma platyrhinos]|uniref:RRM domain-containing protein n=1 Tax=Phrynosoma platyrhinos TaxID=52577 RepID=A0ABQ7SVY8_PHRPL|nr:hypothetical protein JD844_022916 [Phrynosoma platyrhinos]
MSTLPKSNKSDYFVSSTSQETKRHEIQESRMFTSERLPEIADLERRDTRSQAFVSRYLSVESQFPVEQAHLFSLFDLIPGLKSCETHRSLYSNRAYAVVQYSSVASAIYAKQKLHGFEFPFEKNRLAVTFINDGTGQTEWFLSSDAKKAQAGEVSQTQVPATEILLQAADVPADSFAPPMISPAQRRLDKEIKKHFVTSQLSSKIQKSTLPVQLLGSLGSHSSSSHLQADTELPLSKRKAPPDSLVRERLLILFNPHPLPQDILDNVLSRFGNFINVYVIPGENIAYAMFADRASAGDAIAVLHGKTVNGVKLKVILADLPMEDSSKRQRMF